MTMRTLWRAFLFWLAVLGGSAVRADSVLFYQPLNVDSALSSAEWTGLWRDSRRHGVRTLIVQWTRHGDSDFGGAQGWLLSALRSAHAEGLALVLGLTYDPDYYARLNNGPGVAYHWHQWLMQSRNQQRWLVETADLPVAGWYLPMELDDATYRDPALRKEISRQLAVFAAQLDRPLHLSTFSAGKLAPTVYAAWLNELQAIVQVWWQDGAGTASLSRFVRSAYEAALPCQIGIVREAFRANQGPGESFRAEPGEPQWMAQSCHPQAVFSLRYRPWGHRLLDNQRAVEAAAPR